MTFKNLAIFAAVALVYYAAQMAFVSIDNSYSFHRDIGKGVVVDRVYVPDQNGMNLGTVVESGSGIGGYVGTYFSSERWYLLVEVDHRTYPVRTDAWCWTKFKEGSGCRVFRSDGLFSFEYRMEEE